MFAHRKFAGLRRSSLLLKTLLTAAVMSAPLHAQAAWVSVNPALPLDTGAPAKTLATDKLMHVHISLKLRNKDELDQLVKNLYTPGNPAYGRYLTPTQFTAEYSPTAEDAQKVADYLGSMGFSKVSISKNRVLVSGQATAATMEKAFNTHLREFDKSGRTVHANIADVQLPEEIAGKVLSVLGLENVITVKTGQQQLRDFTVYPPLNDETSKILSDTQKAATTFGTQGAYPPPAWDIAYDAADSPDGTNATIAVSTYGDDGSEVVNDLRTMERQYGLPYVPVEVRITDPFMEDPAPTSSAGDDEWDLDTQSATAIANNVKKLIIYSVSEEGSGGLGGLGDLVTTYNEFATAADASAGNMSYGTCELTDDATSILLLPSIKAADQGFEQAVAEGLSWHASSGDVGGACVPINTGLPVGPPGVSYPASSPYVVAVGGTTLLTDADYNYSSEIGWTNSGGGISLLEKAPDWQKGIVPSAVLGAIAGRGVPDISMDAGFYISNVGVGSAADIVVGGSHLAVVGTSLSSPLAVGSWARFESARCNTLGFAAPAYYALDTKGGLLSTADGFHDVILGTNVPQLDTPGWDYVTGFGSLDLAKVNAALPASACDPAVSTPTAALVIKEVTGAAPFSVSFDASTSKDDSGDSIEYYTMDFGDDSIPVQQTSPNFTHSYVPGVYTASLTVRNSHGGYSAPATQTITATGMPDACTLPGHQIASSGAGPSISTPILALASITIPIEDLDMQSISVAEPADMPGKLVFTVKIASLQALESLEPTLFPLTRWSAFFRIKGDPNYYYAALNSGDGVALVSYTYGTRDFGLGTGLRLSRLTTYKSMGTLDDTSSWSEDGTITLVLDKAAIGLKDGDVIQELAGSVAVATPDGLGIPGLGPLAVDSASGRYPYTLIGNDTCAAGITDKGLSIIPSGASHGRFGGALGLFTLLPLAGAALRRRRHRG